MLIYLSIGASLLALFYAGYLAKKLYSMDRGTDKMSHIADAIHSGSMAFLNREYRTLVVFTLAVAVVLALFLGSLETAFAFLVGAVFSAFTGNLGMRIATAANVRTAQAASEDMQKGLKTAFSSGLIMGLSVVGHIHKGRRRRRRPCGQG
jgi:K(+)-stimulated pyrophosphate-energized sodium pump